MKKALQTYLNVILEHIPIEIPDNATQNKENHQIIPHLKCSYYYETVQKFWRDVPKSEINWKRLFDKQSLKFPTIYQRKDFRN